MKTPINTRALLEADDRARRESAAKFPRPTWKPRKKQSDKSEGEAQREN